jgi:hypothetical protein
MMKRTDRTATSNTRLLLGVSAILVLGMQAGNAQSAMPDTTSNAIAPLIPYEQGMANILARGAARPVAVKPITSLEEAKSRGIVAVPGSPVPQMPRDGAKSPSR